MKIVDINGFKYSIQKVDKLSLENSFGTCDYEKQIIEIKKGLSLTQTKQTLIHELTHAFLWCYGFSECTMNDEALCNFIGTYAQQMVDLANDIMSENEEGEKEND